MVNREREQDSQFTMRRPSLKDQVGLVDTISRAVPSDATDQVDARVPNDAVDPWSVLKLFSQMVSLSRLFALSLYSAY
jgi:hypothetical protein